MTDLHSAARALVAGTLPADHDKLTEAIDVLSRAAHTPAVHTCHAECPCQTGGQPVGDFIGDGRSYWDDAYREWLELDR